MDVNNNNQIQNMVSSNFIVNLYNKIKSDSLEGAVLFYSIALQYLRKRGDQSKITINQYFNYVSKKHRNRNNVFKTFAFLQGLKIIELKTKGKEKDIWLNIDGFIDFIEKIAQLELDKYGRSPIAFDKTEKEILKVILNSKTFYRFMFYQFNFACKSNNYTFYEPLFYSIYTTFLMFRNIIEIIRPVKVFDELKKLIIQEKSKVVEDEIKPLLYNILEEIQGELNSLFSKFELMLHPTIVESICKIPEFSKTITDEFIILFKTTIGLYLGETIDKELEKQLTKLQEIYQEDPDAFSRLERKLTRVSIVNSLMVYTSQVLPEIAKIIVNKLNKFEDKIKKVKEKINQKEKELLAKSKDPISSPS